MSVCVRYKQKQSALIYSQRISWVWLAALTLNFFQHVIDLEALTVEKEKNVTTSNIRHVKQMKKVFNMKISWNLKYPLSKIQNKVQCKINIVQEVFFQKLNKFAQ